MNICRQCHKAIEPGQEAQRRTAFGVQKFPHFHPQCWKQLNALLSRSR